MKLIKLFLLCVLLFNSLTGWSLTKGYNQAWLKNNYSYQWLNQSQDQKYIEDLMILNKEGGSEILRMWLFEGISLNQFIYDQAHGTIKLKPEFLKNLTSFLKTARKYNLKVNLTFLDANAFKNLSEKPDLHHFWWNVFNNKYGKLEHFYQEAVAPVYKLIRDEFKDVVTQIDLVNEVNALLLFNMFGQTKVSMSTFLCKLGDQRPVPVTASLGWAKAEEQLFSGILNKSCLDFYDIHLYNDTGAIAHCQEFKRLSRKGYTFQLGEFGQKSKSYDDGLQAQVTANFLTNAHNCGFKAALAWRLDDTRNEYNAEARFSYLGHGMPREAYYTLRDFK